MTDILVGLAGLFCSISFGYFPQFRGYVVMIMTIIVCISSTFLLDSSYRIIFWSAAAFLAPLLLGMIYYVFAASTSFYRFSFAFGHIASILIIWFMAAGVIAYETGYRAAADGEAYRKLQSDFDAYKADSSRAIEEQKQAVSGLQKRLDGEQRIRTELEAEITAHEAKLEAQTKIRSEDMSRMNSVMHNLFFVNNNSTEYLNYYYKQALKICQEEAVNGNIEASFLTGYILDPLNKNIKIDSIHQDADSAMQHYEKAALHGHTDAQYLLGELYYSFKKDKKQAAKYYKLAAENGHKKAKEALKRINGN